MRKRKSEEEWSLLIKDFNLSGLNLTAWCREKGICKSSLYPYLKKSKELKVKPVEQKWETVTMPKSIEASTISLKVGNVTLDIKNGFNQETLMDVLNVVIKLC